MGDMRKGKSMGWRLGGKIGGLFVFVLFCIVFIYHGIVGGDYLGEGGEDGCFYRL